MPREAPAATPPRPAKALGKPFGQPPGKPLGKPLGKPPGQPLGKPPGKPPGKPGRGRGKERGEGWLYGRHAVAAALANPARRWRRLAVLATEAEAALALVAAAPARRLVGAQSAREPERDAVEVLERAALNLLLPEGAVHQGWALAVEPLAAPDLEDVLRAAAASAAGDPAGRSVILVLDRVGDPHNVGAVLRSAAAFGAAAVVVAEHGAPTVTGVLAKAASGALERLPLVRAGNLSRVLDRLKEAGYWCCGLDAAAPAPLASLDLGPRVALVLGSEGGGLRRLVREHCDYLARLPTRPELLSLPDLLSLNVSNAAAIALYELARGG